MSNKRVLVEITVRVLVETTWFLFHPRWHNMVERR